jgi:hypothetical protein
VTIIPVPPGGKPGPTTPDNEPPEEEEDPKSCPKNFDLSGNGNGDDYYDDSYPGAGQDHQPPNYTAPGAGVGKPKTVTVTVTPTETVTVTQDITSTVVVTPTNPYPYTWSNPYETNTIICESSTITNIAGYQLTQCAGKRSTIYAHGTPDPEPVPTEDPKPQPTNGWYVCDEGASGPYGSFCMGRTHPSAPPLDECSSLCDKVVSGCPKGDKGESVGKVVGLGYSLLRWGRGTESYYNGRDCPSDMDNCVEFCKKAAYGPIRKGPDYFGAYAYGCDSSRRRIVAVLADQGACGIRGPGRFRRFVNGTEEDMEDMLMVDMSPAFL